jgi:hypothetical protein
MKRKWIILIVVVFLAALVLLSGTFFGSTPLPADLREKLVCAASFEALALNHIPLSELGLTNADTNMLMGYAILGSVSITNQDLRQELVDAVSYDIRRAYHPPSSCMLEPRHGIRCTNGTNSILMAICYECGDVVVQENGMESGYLIKENRRSPASRLVFERLFHEANVKEDAN